MKLLEVFCKFEDKLVRPNQQEIVVNFTKDVSKNNLIYLFSTEGVSVLERMLQNCLPEMYKGKQPGEQILYDEKQKEQVMSVEVFNVMVCIGLMSLCCEGKSDLAEMKCQNEIMNL